MLRIGDVLPRGEPLVGDEAYIPLPFWGNGGASVCIAATIRFRIFREVFLAALQAGFAPWVEACHVGRVLTIQKLSGCSIAAFTNKFRHGDALLFCGILPTLVVCFAGTYEYLFCRWLTRL